MSSFSANVPVFDLVVRVAAFPRFDTVGEWALARIADEIKRSGKNDRKRATGACWLIDTLDGVANGKFVRY